MIVFIAALLTRVQVAPVSVLRKIPLVPAFVNNRAWLVGSLARSKDPPVGSPVPVPPEIVTQVAPPSVLRRIPRLVAAITIVFPRGATPKMFALFSVPPPLIGVQVAPPFVVLSNPMSAPRSPKLLEPPDPASSV